MAADCSVSTGLMDDLTKEKSNEDVAKVPPPSYQQLLGKPNQSNNSQCRQPLVHVQSTSDQPVCSIKSYLMWSIFNIIFCCCLCGCVACCFSMKTKNLKFEGNIQGALIASKEARRWNTISTTVGTVMAVFNIIYYVCVVVSLETSG